MSITPVNYSDLAELLSVDIGTLRHAVSRGVFTRLPKQGLMQPLIREQALLFQGKKRLSLISLTASERAEWEKYAAMAIARPSTAPKQKDTSNWADMAAMGMLAGAGTLALMPVVLPTGAPTPGMGVPQGSPFPVWQVLLKITH